MKIGFYALLTASLVAGFYFVGIQTENPLLVYAIGVICLFILSAWNFSRYSKKAAQRKYREQMFRQHMHTTLRNQWH
uniref:hypothetical protein n=1 Tax=Pedobacter schmidteae TaxID=2201271 RepID=UPI000EAB6F26|nr:hypothetical protein [Pedobacter schmidteae]